jgi:hypothetical protein
MLSYTRCVSGVFCLFTGVCSGGVWFVKGAVFVSFWVSGNFSSV